MMGRIFAILAYTRLLHTSRCSMIISKWMFLTLNFGLLFLNAQTIPNSTILHCMENRINICNTVIASDARSEFKGISFPTLRLASSRVWMTRFYYRKPQKSLSSGFIPLCEVLLDNFLVFYEEFH